MARSGFGFGTRAHRRLKVAAPGAITDLAVVSTTTNAAEVTFTPASNASSHQYRIDSGAWVAFASNSGSQTIPLAVPGTAYVLSVRGVNATGTGAASNSVTATTQATVTPPSTTQTVSSTYSGGNISAPLTNAGTVYRAWNDVPIVVVNPDLVVGTPTPAPTTNEAGVLSDGRAFTGYKRNQAEWNRGRGTTGQGGTTSYTQGLHNGHHVSGAASPIALGAAGVLLGHNALLTPYSASKSVAFPFTFSQPGTITFSIGRASPIPTGSRSLTDWLQPLVGLPAPPLYPRPFTRDPSVGPDTMPRFYERDVEHTWQTGVYMAPPTTTQPPDGGVQAALALAKKYALHPEWGQLDSTHRNFDPVNQQSTYDASAGTAFAVMDVMCLYNMISEAEQIHWIKMKADAGSRFGDRLDNGGRERGGTSTNVVYGGGVVSHKWLLINAAHTFRNAANTTARARLIHQTDRLAYADEAKFGFDTMFFWTERYRCETPQSRGADRPNGDVFHFMEGEAGYSLAPFQDKVTDTNCVIGGNYTYHHPNMGGFVSQVLLAKKLGIYDTYMAHPARERYFWLLYDFMRSRGWGNWGHWNQYFPPFLKDFFQHQWPVQFPAPTTAPTLLRTVAKGGNGQSDQVWFEFDHLLTFATLPTAADFVVRVNGQVKTPVEPTWAAKPVTDGGYQWGAGGVFRYGGKMGVWLPAGTIAPGDTVTLQYTSNAARPAQSVGFVNVGNIAQQTANNRTGEAAAST